MTRGFTLIEMAVVLVVLALTTHLAVRQLNKATDQRRVTRANACLEEIRAAVFSTDASGESTGFLADMGRLVFATNGTLSELWEKPAAARFYAVRPATRANLVATLADELVNSNVCVGTGWRGPYLRLPIGKRRLLDPWGNAFENPDAAGFDRLERVGEAVVAVSHFGPTAQTNDVCAQRLSLLPSQGSASRLFVQIVSRGGESMGAVDYKWYGPASGLITGACVHVTQASTPGVLEGLTPGVRVLWDSVTGVARLVRVRPGDNQLEIEVP